MIRINLLPEEYNKTARTPIKVLAAVGVALLLNIGLLVWFGWTVFGITAKVDSRRASLQTEMDGINPQVTYHKSLDVEATQYRSRESTLAQVTNSRISWTRKLDELIDTVNRGGEGARHLIWLDDLNVTQTDAAGPNAGAGGYGHMKAQGNSGSAEFAQVANFLEDIENSSFIEDFQPPAPPEGQQSVVDEELFPPVVWSFPLSLDLKNPEERQ
ncbi:MAG: hypothetical protein AAF368_08275 [Planctomycetota bacterium]